MRNRCGYIAGMVVILGVIGLVIATAAAVVSGHRAEIWLRCRAGWRLRPGIGAGVGLIWGLVAVGTLLRRYFAP